MRPPEGKQRLLKIKDLSSKMNHLPMQEGPTSSKRAQSPGTKGGKAARLGELTESCRKSSIKLPCNLYTDGATAGTSGKASRGNRDSCGRISSLADVMEHTVLGKSPPKSRADDQKGASESGSSSSSESSLLTGRYNLETMRPLLFWFSVVF